jgi:CDP-diacylglycerol--serine O-phosphatidyltransferase
MAGLFPDYEHQPTGRLRRFPRLRRVPIRLVLPNVVTLIGLCAGLSAIRMALDHRFELAVYLIVFAAVLDGIDGRVARWLKGTSKFGAELDSLADFVNFGVAPAILLYAWTLDQIKSLGWIVAMLFAVSMSLRLARFNSMIDVEKPAWQGDFFTGMPAPAGAMTVMLPLYIDLAFGLPMGVELAVATALYMLVITFFTVSTVPTYSGKKAGARVPREWVLPLMAFAALFIALMVSFPAEVMMVMTVIYLGLIPYGWVLYRRLEREHRAAAAAADVGEPSEDDQRETAG